MTDAVATHEIQVPAGRPADGNRRPRFRFALLPRHHGFAVLLRQGHVGRQAVYRNPSPLGNVGCGIISPFLGSQVGGKATSSSASIPTTLRAPLCLLTASATTISSPTPSGSTSLASSPSAASTTSSSSSTSTSRTAIQNASCPSTSWRSSGARVRLPATHSTWTIRTSRPLPPWTYSPISR